MPDRDMLARLRELSGLRAVSYPRLNPRQVVAHAADFMPPFPLFLIGDLRVDDPYTPASQCYCSIWGHEMTSQETNRTPTPINDDFRNDLKILAFVFAATMVCMAFMLLAGASASSATAAGG